jgi:hypothetical protein
MAKRWVLLVSGLSLGVALAACATGEPSSMQWLVDAGASLFEAN